MTSLNDFLKLLEEKLEDLQKGTLFCVNNYDYHHKNNEHEIIQNLQDILKDSLHDGQEFLSYMKNVRSAIDTARKKCSKIDELLIEMGVDSDVTQTVGNSAAGSKSFHEEQEKSVKYVDVLEENKEN